jgi:replicative DNA helicase
MRGLIPHDLDAERAVLSAPILRPEVFDQLRVQASDFFHAGHAAVFRAMKALREQGHPIDIVALAARMEAAGDLQRVGDLSGLADIAGATPTAENVSYHERLVVDCAARRRIMQIAAGTSDRARTGEATADEVAEEAIRQLQNCEVGGNTAIGIEVLLKQIVDQVANRRDGEKADGVPTGITLLDERLTFNGWPRSQVTIAAGATSAGKSALALTSVLEAAGQGFDVLCCTFEDAPETVVRRALSRTAKIENRAMQRGVVGAGDEHRRFLEATNQLARTRVAFLDRVPPNIAELTSTIRRHVRENRTDLVVIDFLQLLRSGERHRSRQDEVDAVFSEIVRMAREIPAATLVVSQLRRTGDRPPTKEDLYHSGALEQWSHTVLLLWRPNLPAFPRLVSLIVAKQKNGGTGRLALGWNGTTCSYCDPDPAEASRFEAALEKVRVREDAR